MEHIKANNYEDNDYLDSNSSQPLVQLRWLNVRNTEQPHQKTLSVYCKHICKNKHREKNKKKQKQKCLLQKYDRNQNVLFISNDQNPITLGKQKVLRIASHIQYKDARTRQPPENIH
jgi:hypothetical protein